MILKYDKTKCAWLEDRKSEKTTRISVALSENLLQQIRDIAWERRESISSFVRQIIEKEVNLPK